MKVAATTFGLILLTLGLFSIDSIADESPKLDFNRDIRPILSDNCFQCHGPDGNKRKADLRLDTKDGMFDEIDDIHPVTPGHVDQSEIYKRMISTDPKEKMPPAKANKTLSAEQIAKIKTWIEQGAEFNGHWAYIPPIKSAVPKIENGGNPIDAFIAERLAAAKLTPSKEADRVTLCRRIYFDLLGLPPDRKSVV